MCYASCFATPLPFVVHSSCSRLLARVCLTKETWCILLKKRKHDVAKRDQLSLRFTAVFRTSSNWKLLQNDFSQFRNREWSMASPGWILFLHRYISKRGGYWILFLWLVPVCVGTCPIVHLSIMFPNCFLKIFEQLPIVCTKHWTCFQ